MEEFQIVSIVRGHHVYKFIWTPHIGELLVGRVESDNSEDDHAVAIVKGSVLVGHVPHEFSRIFLLLFNAWWFYRMYHHRTSKVWIWIRSAVYL